MSKIPPRTTLKLYSIPNYGMNEEPMASSKEELNNYVNKYVVLTNINATYQRRTRSFKFQLKPNDIAAVESCNLCSWVNPDFENIIYYGRIVSPPNYTNNNEVIINFRPDEWMSRGHSLTYHGGFIEREHLSNADFAKAETNPYDPTIYEFQTDEGLAVGQTMYDPPGSPELYPSIPSGELIYTNKCILVFTPTFDKESLPGGLESITAHCSEYIEPDGTVVDVATGSSDSLDLLMPHAFYIFVLYGTKYNSLSDLLNSMDAAGLERLSNKYTYKWIYDRFKSINRVGGTASLRPVEFPETTEWENKKLYRSPFHYLEVQNNTGDKKDYCYEYVNADSKHIYFNYVPMIEVDCYSSLIPTNYYGNFPNLTERVDSTPWPEIADSTNAFVSFLASKNQEILSQRFGTLETLPASEKSQNFLAGALTGKVGKMLGVGIENESGLTGAGFATVGAAKGVASGGGVVSSIASGVTGGVSGYDYGKQYGIASEYQDDSLAGADYYGKTKSAYAVNNYTPGTQPALSHAIEMTDKVGNKLEYGTGIFLFLHRKMRDIILKVFDDMFTQIGYASKRYGTPRVCNYIKGKTDPSELPHINSRGFTYCKCQGLHVTGASVDVTAGIEQMFASGIRFYKVD